MAAITLTGDKGTCSGVQALGTYINNYHVNNCAPSCTGTGIMIPGGTDGVSHILGLFANADAVGQAYPTSGSNVSNINITDD
jgi:hypothetical protein